MLVFVSTLPELVSQGLQNLMRQILAFEVLIFNYFNKKEFGLYSPKDQTEETHPIPKETCYYE